MKKFDFNYTPQKLVETNKKIKKEFPTFKELKKKKVKKYQDLNLQEILKKVKEIDREAISYFANNLSNKEVYTLAYSFNQISEQDQNKVKDVLVSISRKKVVRIMWNNFCDDFSNSAIIKYFIDIRDKINDLGFSKPPYALLKDIFANKEPIKNITNYILDKNLSYENALEIFDLNEKAEISLVLAEDVFSNCKFVMFKNEDADFLISLFSSLPVKKIKGVAENYLLLFKVDNFKEELMEVFLKKVGDPRKEYSKGWQNIKQTAHKKAIKWLNRKVLRDFFNNIEADQEEAKERFDYWLKYEDYLKDASYISYRLQLFLVFKNFVVVEFGKKGNAAYIYERDYFENNFAKYMSESNSVRNNKLKHTSLARDRYNNQVKKINHTSAWQIKADNKIKPLLS